MAQMNLAPLLTTAKQYFLVGWGGPCCEKRPWVAVPRASRGYLLVLVLVPMVLMVVGTEEEE